MLHWIWIGFCIAMGFALLGLAVLIVATIVIGISSDPKGWASRYWEAEEAARRERKRKAAEGAEYYRRMEEQSRVGWRKWPPPP
jgi:hypothetical protein